MKNWQEYFYIATIDCRTNDDPFEPDMYELRIISNDEVVGTYNDVNYTKKQARYKFKKISKKLEKILLG